MAVTQYIGSRYVTAFADPIDWSPENTYEELTAVHHQGVSYISKQPVPKGIDISNTTYWIYWADPNVQIELYRRETAAAAEEAQNALAATEQLQESVQESLDEIEQYLTTYASKAATIINRKAHYLGWCAAHESTQSIGAGCPITESIWAQAYSSDGDNGIITLLNLDSGAETVDNSVNVGHANGVAYDSLNKRLYVVSGRYGSSANPTYTQDIHIYAVNENAMSLTYIETISPEWIFEGVQIQLTGIGYDAAKDKLYVNGRWCEYFAELNRSTQRIEGTIKTSAQLRTSATQTIAAYDGYIYMLLAIPNIIVIYNANNGLLVSYVPIDTYNDYRFAVRELQGMGFINGKLQAVAHLGRGTFGQIVSLAYDDKLFSPYYSYYTEFNIDVSTTNHRGNGTSASSPMPTFEILREMEVDRIVQLNVSGDFDSYPYTYVELYCGCAINLLNFNSAQNIKSLVIQALDSFTLYGYKPNGVPTREKSALIINNAGAFRVQSCNFANAQIPNDGYDIKLLRVAEMCLQQNTPRANDTIHIQRQQSCVITTPSTGVATYTVSGTAAPSLI